MDVFYDIVLFVNYDDVDALSIFKSNLVKICLSLSLKIEKSRKFLSGDFINLEGV